KPTDAAKGRDTSQRRAARHHATGVRLRAFNTGICEYLAHKGLAGIGSGAGFAGDRIDPAMALAEHGKLGYLVFECLAERTIALAVRAKRDDPEKGYDPLLQERLSAVLPAAAANKVKIISNMGAANPVAAARAASAIARKMGIGPLNIAAIAGDDVLAEISGTSPLLEGGT